MNQPKISLPKLKLITSSKSEVFDFREARIKEFFVSRELSLLTKEAYTTAFKQFLDWSDLDWQEGL